MKLADLSSIENVDFCMYQTCRGKASKSEFENIINTLLDPNSDEDLFDDAVNDGLWDLFSHQYTLYSATPLALYLILTKSTQVQRNQNSELLAFIELCQNRGNNGIFLTEEELNKNKQGLLPIFSIPEILRKYA